MAAAARTASPEELLTLREVGELLGVSPVTAWRRVRAGEIRAINVGAERGRPQLRVRPSAVAEYQRRREIQPLPKGRAA